MAKIKKTISFKNAEIDTDKMLLSEFNKDGDMVTQYQIVSEILEQFAGMRGISLTISTDEDM